MPIFRNTKTGRPALCIIAYDPKWNNIDSPNLIRVRGYEDLPFTEDMVHIYSQLNIHSVVWEFQGRIGFYAYLSEFFMDDWCREPKRWFHFLWDRKRKKLFKEGKKAGKDFWFLLLPSGFPNGGKGLFPEGQKNTSIGKVNH